MAEAIPDTTPKERALIALASVVPDLDGLGVIADGATKLASKFSAVTPTELFATYHHDLHTLPFALVCSGLAALALGRGPSSLRRLGLSAVVFLSFHLHLLCDFLGSRGPDDHQWPIPYLKPFGSAVIPPWAGQWKLNAWPNMALTVGLLALAGFLLVRRGYGPLSVFAPGADAAVVRTLRARFAPGRLSAEASSTDEDAPA